MKQKTETATVKLHKLPIKLPIYLLDSYSRKAYGKDYQENKKQVSIDVRELSKLHNTTRAQDIRLLLTLALLPEGEKTSMLAKYGSVVVDEGCVA